MLGINTTDAPSAVDEEASRDRVDDRLSLGSAFRQDVLLESLNAKRGEKVEFTSRGSEATKRTILRDKPDSRISQSAKRSERVSSLKKSAAGTSSRRSKSHRRPRNIHPWGPEAQGLPDVSTLAGETASRDKSKQCFSKTPSKPKRSAWTQKSPSSVLLSSGLTFEEEEMAEDFGSHHTRLGTEDIRRKSMKRYDWRTPYDVDLPRKVMLAKKEAHGASSSEGTVLSTSKDNGRDVEQSMPGEIRELVAHTFSDDESTTTLVAGNTSTAVAQRNASIPTRNNQEQPLFPLKSSSFVHRLELARIEGGIRQVEDEGSVVAGLDGHNENEDIASLDGHIEEEENILVASGHEEEDIIVGSLACHEALGGNEQEDVLVASPDDAHEDEESVPVAHKMRLGTEDVRRKPLTAYNRKTPNDVDVPRKSMLAKKAAPDSSCSGGTVPSAAKDDGRDVEQKNRGGMIAGAFSDDESRSHRSVLADVFHRRVLKELSERSISSISVSSSSKLTTSSTRSTKSASSVAMPDEAEGAQLALNSLMDLLFGSDTQSDSADLETQSDASGIEDVRRKPLISSEWKTPYDIDVPQKAKLEKTEPPDSSSPGGSVTPTSKEDRRDVEEKICDRIRELIVDDFSDDESRSHLSVLADVFPSDVLKALGDSFSSVSVASSSELLTSSTRFRKPGETDAHQLALNSLMDLLFASDSQPESSIPDTPSDALGIEEVRRKPLLTHEWKTPYDIDVPRKVKLAKIEAPDCSSSVGSVPSASTEDRREAEQKIRDEIEELLADAFSDDEGRSHGGPHHLFEWNQIQTTRRPPSPSIVAHGMGGESEKMFDMRNSKRMERKSRRGERRGSEGKQKSDRRRSSHSHESALRDRSASSRSRASGLSPPLKSTGLGEFLERDRAKGTHGSMQDFIERSVTSELVATGIRRKRAHRRSQSVPDVPQTVTSDILSGLHLVAMVPAGI